MMKHYIGLQIGSLLHFTIVREGSTSNSNGYNPIDNRLYRVNGVLIIFKMNVYTDGALWRMKLKYEGNVLSLYAALFTGKHDVIHKTGCTMQIALSNLSSQKNRGTATGNMYSKLREVWTCGFRADGSTVRQT